MRILYFYQYFSTPSGSWGTRAYEFALEWVKAGHEVTVVSGIYSKSNLTAKRLTEDQVFDGIKVKVLNISIDNKQNVLRRITSFMLYSMLSSWYALALQADIVIASSGPITVGIPGLIARYMRNRKLVFEVRDLWPDGAIELGIIKNRFIIWLARWFEKQCYNASSLIVCLSPGMKKHILSKSKQQNVISVTNAANIGLFKISKHILKIERLNGRRYAIYTGNIGKVNNSFWLLNAAEELTNRGRSDIVILVVGDGQLRRALSDEAEKRRLDNLVIHGLVPKEDLVGLIQNAVASLVPLIGSPVLDTSSPNKFFESLAAGVPVIQNTSGWMKDFLTEHRVGFTVAPDDYHTLADILISLSDDPSVRMEIRPRAMALAEKLFDKVKLAERMLSAMTQIER